MNPDLQSALLLLAGGEARALASQAAWQRREMDRAAALIMDAARNVIATLPTMETLTRRRTTLVRDLLESAPGADSELTPILADLELAERELAVQIGDIVRALQCEDLILQTLDRARKQLDLLKVRAEIWEAARVQFQSPVGLGTLGDLLARLQALDEEPIHHHGIRASSLDAGEIELF